MTDYSLSRPRERGRRRAASRQPSIDICLPPVSHRCSRHRHGNAHSSHVEALLCVSDLGCAHYVLCTPMLSTCSHHHSIHLVLSIVASVIDPFADTRWCILLRCVGLFSLFIPSSCRLPWLTTPANASLLYRCLCGTLPRLLLLLARP